MLTKSVVGNQIKALRLEKGLSQEEFGAPVDLTRSAISQIESGQMYPSLESIDKIVQYYSTSWNSLVGISKGQKATEIVTSPARTLITTVDKSGKDNIVLVPIKAQAGYLQGAQQTEYIEHLPAFWIPGLNHGTFRAFEVSGYSMLADRTGFFPGDIVVGEYVERLEDIKDGFVYILVNNAGIGRFAPIKDLSIEDFDAMWSLNMRALFLCTQRAIPLMAPQRQGAIVNISSLAGKIAFIGGGGYSATKWALLGFAKTLMLEVREQNIRVVTICPGSVDTTFSSSTKDTARSEKIIHPQDIADTLVTVLTLPDRTMVSEIDIRPTNRK